MKLFLLLTILVSVPVLAQQKLMFDLSHGQFQNVFVDPSFYDYVIPGYKKILMDQGIEYVENREEITEKSLKGIDVMLMLSPHARSTQEPITDVEKQAIIRYIKKGGKLFVTGETMVGLLMGNPDGDRNVHKGMETNRWGKDSRRYMSDLIRWAVQK